MKDNPRIVTGLNNNNFENLNQEQFTEAINALFSPAIEWECGTIIVDIPVKNSTTETMTEQKKIGWLYSSVTEQKPIIAQKSNDSEKISSGDIYYRWGIDTAKKQIDNLLPKFMPARKVWGVMQKDYLEGRDLVKPTSSWTFKDVNSERGTEEFVDLGFDKRVFPKPKPVGTIERCVKLCSKNDGDIIMDFFSGSSTTAQSVMHINALDDLRRTFIMIQYEEACIDGSDAKKAGFNNICEIGKERIRRAGEKIKSESPMATADLDVGFRVLKLDDGNMKDVYYSADRYSQDMLSMFESNIKEDRTDLDLLFGCILDWGLPLSMPYTSEKIDGYTIHNYNDGDLIACFDKDIPESVIKTIVNKHPLRAVFRDSGFEDSPSKINVFEIFKLLAPDTSVKVL